MSNPPQEPSYDHTFTKDEESAGGKLTRKAKEFPFMPIGLSGAVLGCLYGAYKYRSRGEMSTSIFLIHLRVAAQGAVVSALTLGIAYSLIRDLMYPHVPETTQPIDTYRPKPHPMSEPRHPNYEKPRKE